jgi:NADH:ubiquinone oxidoreductase subunit F (NADH-binding)
LPGEEIELTSPKHVVEEGDLITRSSKRQKVICPIFHTCGGCDFLHIMYDEQVSMKEKYLNESFKPLKYPSKIHVIPNPKPLHYRHKVVLSATNVKTQLRLGLYREQSKEVIPFLSCYLHDEKTNDVLKTIEDVLNVYKIKAYDLDAKQGIMKHVLIRKSYHEKTMMVVLVTQGHILPHAKDMVQIIREKHPEVITIIQNIHRKNTRLVLLEEEKILYGTGYIFDQIDDLKFRLSARSFYQINPLQMMKLYEQAIDLLRTKGLLGQRILGTEFSFDIEIRVGAGAFVCGEETALMASIEGKRGMPRSKPPFPAVKGLWGHPTIINNVETFANLPYIFRPGGLEAYKAIGTEKSKGTKVFSLAGKIKNVGLVEVPMGTTLRELIFDIGGGIEKGKKFKAIQTGGPSGGCLTEEDLDTPIDFDNLIARGSMMGSGGAIVMDEDNCMVDVAKFYLEFICDESCGKCSPCRIGTTRMKEILDKIASGTAVMSDLDTLKELAIFIKDASLCGLGQTAPNPVLSTLTKFYDEYKAHIIDKTCPAKVCKDLIQYRINPDTCKKCGICAIHCPVNCISGVRGKEAYVIDQMACIKCGTCLSSCPFDVIRKV